MDILPLKTKVIVNPDSNPRVLKRHLRPALRILRNAGFELSITFTKGPDQVEPVARKAADQGFDVIIAVGGDGTTNESINGIIGQNVVLGLLPIGGSNVLARELGYPMDLCDAARLITRRSRRKIDLGCINGRYFSMMASCGYDAYAISRTSLKVKRFLRRYAYLFAGIKDFLGYTPTEIEVVIDNNKAIDKGTLVVIGNSHFYGGTHQMTPYAEIDDGFLDLCIYQGKTQIGLVRFALAMFSRQHLNMKNVKYYRVRRIEMRSSKKTMVQVDGDPLGELPMTAHVEPRILDVFC